MKPLPFELPAMICFDKESVAAQRETMEAEENNPDDHIRKIVAWPVSGEKRQGAAMRGRNEADRENERFSVFESVYRKQIKKLHKEGAEFFYIETPGSLSEARAALFAAKKSFSGPAIITFKVDEEGVSEFGSDAMALLAISEGMGAAAFGLCSDCSCDALLEVLLRISPYAKIPLIAVGEKDEVKKLAERIPQIGLFLCTQSGSLTSASVPEKWRRPEFCEKDPELIIAASGAEAFFVDATVDFLQEIECDSDFPEKILDAEVESGGLRILIRSQDDVDILDQYQYMINRPVSICSESPELLEAALKIYNGRAFFDGTCDMEEHYIQYLQEFYGLIVL